MGGQGRKEKSGRLLYGSPCQKKRGKELAMDLSPPPPSDKRRRKGGRFIDRCDRWQRFRKKKGKEKGGGDVNHSPGRGRK